MHGGLQLIASVKIAPAIGERATAVRPHLAESAASDPATRPAVQIRIDAQRAHASALDAAFLAAARWDNHLLAVSGGG